MKALIIIIFIIVNIIFNFVFAKDAITYPFVKHVHVITSCHLDIGFKDTSANILNNYFDIFIPRAVEHGKLIRQNKFPDVFHGDRLDFMFQSWVISMYLDCPINMGLHCPSKENITATEEAIRKGDITWHAFPHNAQLEIMSESMIEAGLDLTFRLDEKFNLKKKQTLSQRDVPGASRSIIPILKRNNVTAISIGANGGSTPPALPPCFVWQDQNSQEEIYGLCT